VHVLTRHLSDLTKQPIRGIDSAIQAIGHEDAWGNGGQSPKSHRGQPSSCPNHSDVTVASLNSR
jgi:hypothetical protein